jgi:glycosyltransferase involved in cell wall biosynthesis
MKIVAISGSQVPSNVANSLQTMKAVHALAQLGHAVTLIVPFQVAPVPEKDHTQIHGENRWLELATFYGLQKEFQVEYLPSASRRLFFLSAVRRAKSLKPDLLYVWPLPSAVLGLMNGLPVVLELHDLPSGRVGPLWFRYFRDFKGKKRLAVITSALKEALAERYGAYLRGITGASAGRSPDVVLAPNGVEPERFEQLPGQAEARRTLGLPEAPTVVCTGHLYAGRGVELFSQLAASFQEKGVRFVWAGGRSTDIEMWKAQTRDIPNLTFCGFIPNALLPMYQAAGDVLLMPYNREIGVSSGAGHSGQISSPMKMFEYLATGRAILASDLPVFHEVLSENNAVFCPPENLPAWENALQGLLDSPARREELARQARLDAQKYSWTERAKRILDGFPG